MDIANVSSNPLSSAKSVASSDAMPAVGKERSYGEQQPATIVTLSAQARQLNMEQQTTITHTQSQAQTRTNQTQSSNQADKAAVAKVETSAREAAEAPVKRQQENNEERKRINTYA